MSKATLLSMDPVEHARQIRGESDRASMILSGSMIEDALETVLHNLMKANINSTERDRLFGFEGPLGTFANKIRFAQALGHIDRPTRKKIELIKEIRNAAAHAHGPISFGVQAIRQAVITLVGDENKKEVSEWDEGAIRDLFEMLCVLVTAQLARIIHQTGHSGLAGVA